MADEGWLRAHLQELTEANEAGRADPWNVAGAPEGFVRELVRAVVGLRLRVERLEGSWKLIQHRSEADRGGHRRAVGLRRGQRAGRGGGDARAADAARQEIAVSARERVAGRIVAARSRSRWSRTPREGLSVGSTARGSRRTLAAVTPH